MIEPLVWTRQNTAPKCRVFNSDFGVEIEHVVSITPLLNQLLTEVWDRNGPKVVDGKLVHKLLHARCIIPVYGGLDRPQMFLCFGVQCEG